MGRESPVLGRPSPAAESAAPLRATGGTADAAFRADGGDGGWCGLRAASVAGVRHRLAAEAGQDSFAWAYRPDRLVVAVADGLGGVPDSATTASRAVAAAVRAATEGVGPAPIQLTAALKAANAAADGGGATTIVLAVLAPDGQASLIRVGDSTAIVIRDGGTSWQELFAGPDDDEGVVATVTAALPTGDPVPEEAEVALGPGDVLVLMTDGVADPWRDGPKTVAPALAAALAAHPDPWELAHLADFSRQGCHDDRTLVAIWPRASNG